MELRQALQMRMDQIQAQIREEQETNQQNQNDNGSENGRENTHPENNSSIDENESSQTGNVTFFRKLIEFGK